MIRSAVAEDAAALAALHRATTAEAYRGFFAREALPPSLEELTADWAAAIADPAMDVLVAEVGARIVAEVRAGASATPGCRCSVGVFTN